MSEQAGSTGSREAASGVVRRASATSGAPELTVFPEVPGFRIIQELARSPKGTIYKARRLVEQDVVAIKVFREAVAAEPDFGRRLQRNAEASFLLEHPGLARCLGCLEEGQQLVLIMEYGRGEPVSRALQRNVRFLPPRALAIALQCVGALHYAAERKRFHGRLHPGDLVVNDDEVRLLGVGLGELPEHPRRGVKDPHLFEPLVYTAPEALPVKPFPAGEEGQRAADLYALGAILYHMLTGSQPFRSGEAGALAQERAALSPLVVRWPRGTDRSLPQHAVALVERLLSPDPVVRGDYARARAVLAAALREAEGQPVGAPARPAAPALAPVEVPERPAPTPAPLPSLPPPAPAMASRHAPVVRRYEERDHSSAVLIGAVAVVLAYALGLATKTFLLKGPQSPPAPVAVPSPPAPATPAPEVRLQPAAPAATAAAEDQAARKLKLIKELLAEGAARYDTALLRELHDIAAKAGETSRTGLEAKLLINQVEERLARGGEAAVAQPPAKTGADAEEKVFSELVQRARDLAAQQRFGDALGLLRQLPPGLKLAPYPELAAQEAAPIEQQAKAAFADVTLAAEQALAAGDYAKARALYQNVQVRWGMPTWGETAAARVRLINETEDKALQTQAVLRAQQTKAQELGAGAAALRSAAARAYEFRYAESREELDKFARSAQDPELRKLAADYAQLVEDEGRLFARCRTRLHEQIQRDPNRSSPLQVLNKDRQPLYDITDYDERGIKVTAVRGGAGGERVQEWNTLDPRQPFVMLQLLSEKSSAADRLALASAAFHQSLRAEAEAAKGGAQAPHLEPQKLRETALDLKNSSEAELNGAVQADLGARDKQAAQRALMQRIAQLLANPQP